MGEKEIRLSIGQIGKCVSVILMSVMLLAAGMPLAALAEVDISAPVLAADWQTVQNAVSNSSDDIVKIRVTKDMIVLSDSAHNTGKTIEIDLDGHTIHGSIHQVFWNEKGTMTIKNGTIKNAVSDFGGAINNRGTMHLEDVVITDCTAIQGGGILNYGTLTMTGGAIKNCKAGRGGGLRILPHDSDKSQIAQSATATLTGVEISGNTVNGGGDSYGRGAGIGVSNGTLTMTDCTLSGNKSTNDDGGGIDFDASGKILTLDNTIISDNAVSHSERQGGGINLERGDAFIKGCSIIGNIAPDGGGINISSAFGTAEISGTTIENNKSTTNGGGGISNKASLILKGTVTVMGNTASDNSGGIYHNGKALNIQGKITVKENKPDNLYLYKGKKIKVTGTLDNNSHIGVIMPDENRTITDGFQDSGNTNENVFVPDGSGTTELDESGEVRISTEESLLPGDLLDKVTVSFHPVGQSSSLCIRDNGGGAGQNVVQLYNIGDSFRFWLTKADDDSYYIDFFGGADDYDPSDKRLDLSDNDGYDHLGNVVHVVKGHETAMNKRWQFVRNSDGTYFIKNKRSGLYWDLQNDNYDNKNKLCQWTLDRAQRWEMEIVRSDGAHSINDLKKYDSYSFGLNGRTVTGANWMSFLSDDTLLSDITMPGTHDAGTAQTNVANANAQCQQLSIHDQLYNGIRYFDMRFGGGKKQGLTIVHGALDTCLYKGHYLTLDIAMEWVTTFLRENKGETVILQIKEDRGGKDVEKQAYEYFKDLAKNKPELIYIGDHIPKLGECRGKMVILSRLQEYDNSDFAAEGGQWALDVSGWKRRRDMDSLYDPLGLAASGDHYEVWDQDDHKKVGDDKWKLICNSAFDSKTGAAAKRAAVQARNKDAWVVSYTSCVRSYPQNSARTLNPKLVNKLLTDPDVLAGQYLGVICSDFSDQQLAYLVYKQNFISEECQVTIKGITVDGKEPIPEIVMDVMPDEQLNNLSDTLEEQIRKHFSTHDYQPYDAALALGLLTSAPLSELKNPDDYQKAVANLEDYHGYDEPVFYVALGRALHPNDGSGETNNVTIEAPPCTTVISGSNGEIWTDQIPKPKISLGIPHIRLAKKNGVEIAYWYDPDTLNPYNGPMADRPNTHCHFELEPEWGYYFIEDDKAWTGNLKFTCNEYTRDLYADMSGQILYCIADKITVKHRLQLVDFTAPGCLREGMEEHYYCTECGRRYNIDKVEVKNVSIPSRGGHNWGDWTVKKEATDKEEGLETRTCQNQDCREEESRVIPVKGHKHVLQEVPARAATCEEDGSKGYWICSEGDHPCGRYFSDAEGTKEIDRDLAVIPKYGHSWSSPVYTWSEDYSTVTAKRVCLHDHTHIESDTANSVISETVPASCEQNGSISHKAAFHNEVFEDQTCIEDVPALGHDWDEGVLTKEASCTEDGVLTYTCKRDKTHTRTETIPASGHNFDTRIASTTATCTEAGVQTVETYCTNCGQVVSTKEEKAEALGHDWSLATYTWAEDKSTVTARRVCENDPSHVETETVNVNETGLVAKCEIPGETRWYTDAFENEDFMIQEIVKEIPPFGHNWGSWTVTKEATETETGEETRICLRCEKKETRVIPARNHVHTLKHVDAKNATCSETGNIEYWVCEGGENSCGRFFSDKEGKIEIEKEQTVIAALGHDWGDWQEDIPATCSSRGVEIRVCKRNLLHQEFRVTEMDPDAHDWGDWQVIKEATEEEEGQERRICQNDPSHVETRTIPVLEHAHKLTKTEKKDATCTETGNIEYYICSGCRKLFSDAEGKNEIHQEDTIIPKSDHTPEVIKGKEATCTEPGLTDGSMCSVCKEILKKQEEIPARGHQNTEVRDAKEASCTEEGYSGDTYCKDCGQKIAEGKVIPKKDHTPVTDKAVPATATSTGLTEGSHCSVCGEIIVRQQMIPRLTNPEGDKGDVNDPASVASVEKTIAKNKNDGDIKGSTFGLLQLRAKKVSKKAIRLAWTKVNGADGYIIYGNRCNTGGKKYPFKVLKVLKGNTWKKSWLKKGTYYKFMAVAYKKVNGSQKILAFSKTIHVATSGGKVGNYKAVRVNKKAVKLKKGKTFRIKTKQVPESRKRKVRKHRAVCFESSNPAVAVVSKSGKVKGKRRGACYIYVYSQSGTFAKVKTKVK